MLVIIIIIIIIVANLLVENTCNSICYPGNVVSLRYIIINTVHKVVSE